LSGKRKPVLVNKEQWSRSSKQSLAYDFARKTYSNITFKCQQCGADEVFTAEAQKRAYEDKKAYIWQRRVLCASCWKDEQLIAKSLRSYMTKWKLDKQNLKSDAVFLQNWLELLELHPYYGARKNTALIAMVSKCLQLTLPRSIRCAERKEAHHG
jgi:Probable zinc-ribbon domain